MKIVWKWKTDEEFIKIIRVAYLKSNRWKWVLIGTYGFLLLILLVLGVGNLGLFSPMRIIPVLPSSLTTSDDLTYGIGFFGGFAFGFLLSMFGFLLINFVMELRAWKLFLAYHDRLQQAGLLPPDAADKMELVDLPSSGS